MVMLASATRPLAVLGGLCLGAAFLSAVLEGPGLCSAEEPPRPPIGRRLLLSLAAGVGAFAVGLSWGRWLEGPRDEEPPPPRDDQPD